MCGFVCHDLEVQNIMRALVIGGTGTISRGIVRALHRRGSEVAVFNRGQRSAPLPDDVEYIVGDRTDREAFETAMRKREFDVVYDMISFFPPDAESAIRAFRGNIGHFIQISTVMTYGPPFAQDGINLDEDSPLNGKHQYGAGKTACDNILREASADGAFPLSIVKPSGNFGEGRFLLRQADWWPGWIQRLRDRRPVISVGDGTTMYQWLPGAGAGEAMAAMAGLEASFGETYVVTNPHAVSWDTWIRTVAAVLGVEADVVHIPRDVLVEADPERFLKIDDFFGHNQVFSMAKLQALLPDWEPGSLTDGIEGALEWMDENIDMEGLRSDAWYGEEDRLIDAVRRFTGTLRAQISG